MEDEILNVYKDADITKVKGSSGNFIVEVDGKVIYSKQHMKAPRFPEVGEITELIKKMA